MFRFSGFLLYLAVTLRGNSPPCAGITKLGQVLQDNNSSLMSKLFLFLLFTLAIAFFAGTGETHAQVPQVSDDAQVKTFEVRLPVTVLQKKNLITGLSRNDFAVFEDGV